MSFDQEFTPVQSGHLDAVHYDSMGKRLTVRFQNGAEYHVHNVSPEDYQDFMSAPSPGQHYHSVLKKNFKITRAK
jgi:hypothetical protein